MSGRFKKSRVKFGMKMNFQNFWTLPKISKLSLAKRHSFEEKFGSKPQNKKGLLFAVGDTKAFFGFFTLGIPDPLPKSGFHQISTSKTFSHYWERSCPNFVKVKING